MKLIDRIPQPRETIFYKDEKSTNYKKLLVISKPAFFQSLDEKGHKYWEPLMDETCEEIIITYDRENDLYDSYIAHFSDGYNKNLYTEGD